MFFQLVINSKKKNFRLDFVFGNLISMSTETHMVPLNGITFKIKDIPFNLYFVNDYFVIENLNKLFQMNTCLKFKKPIPAISSNTILEPSL
jgi:hypothetical protein